ncbi:aldehyde dehydrogenase 5, mitochondrial-like [Asbolus verrucosus]|uniref:Aldehyde dehydrogenase 5, mitochondrial-like n=1 Tax=Asbolus verrucosus TaxID=1661398 RepID=A0A482VXP3_ASBVE|nr:aldehyde dehydrogenase 5, mitochondrial-like [Asbolus verrucosus]
MMDDKANSKNNTIKQIFETMSYGDDTENITKAIEWLKAKNNRLFAHIDKNTETPNGEILSLKNVNNDEALCDIYIPEAVTVEAILKKLGDAKNEWMEMPPMKRAELVFKLGDEVHKNQNLFVQLEVITRGILASLLSTILKILLGNPKARLTVGIVSDKNSISALGCILAPALASGYNVVLQTGPQLSLVAALLIDLAIQVGIPEDTIRLIPGNIEPSVFFTHPKVSIISVFDDLHKQNYFIGNHFGKKILNFYSSGIPMLVFEGCDLDSACHSVVDATWGYNGMLPWSVKNIFIQENTYGSFVRKLKQRVDKIVVDASNKKNADISFPARNVSDKLKTVIEKAKSEGVEIYQPNSSSPFPALLIGGNIFNNNVIKEDFIDVPIITLTAFRTINEAAALANNTRQGLAASVWTENNSLANELIRKLKVGTIWFNSHGLFSADISTSPYKSSGNAHFGGKEGFYEYVQLKSLKNETTSQLQSGEAMEKAISDAKKAQESWYKLSRFDRVKNLQRMMRDINVNKTTWGLPEKWVDDWIVSVHEYNLNHRGESFATHKGYNVISFREPFGVVTIEALEDIESHNKKLIIAALIEGNSVIVLNDSKAAIPFYSSISQLLPKDVFVVVPLVQDAVKIAALHKELGVYFGEKGGSVFWSLPLKSSSKFKVVNFDKWDHVRDKVTLIKNVWCNLGQSFI